MARRGKPTIRITADADGVKRGTKDAEHHLSRLEKSGTKSLNQLKTAGAAAGAGLIGGLVLGAKASADAAIEAETAHARLTAQLKASGISYKAHRDEIERVIQAHSRLSGLDDEDLQDSFVNIVRATKDVDKSLRLVGIAADFARAKHLDVAKAGDIVAKVAGGNVGILGRYGIQLDKNATSAEALAELQKRFAGQAEGYGKTTAGSIDRMKVSAENLAEKVGGALAPTLADTADKVTKFVGEMETGTGAGGDFADAAGKVADVVGDIGGFLKDHPKLVAVAVGAWGAYKLASIAAMTAVKVQTFRKAFAKSVPVAAEQGAVAGAAYGSAFDAASAKGVNKMVKPGSKWMLALRAAGPIAAALLVAEVAGDIIPGDNSLTGDADGDGVSNNVAGKTPAGFRDTPAGKQQQQRTEDAQPLKGNANPLKTRKLPGGFPKTHGKVKAASSMVTGPAGRAAAGAGARSVMATAGVPPLAAFLSRKFGVTFSSGYRTPEHNREVGGVEGSWHTRGSLSRPGAIDLVGSAAAMSAALAWAKENISGLAEAMIHDVGSGLHLHLAGTGVMNWTSATPGRPPGAPPTVAPPARRKPLTGVDLAADALYKAGFRGQDLVNMLAIAGRESGYDPGATNLKGPDHSIGLLQINQLAHHGKYGTDEQLKNPYRNAVAAFDLFKRNGYSPWGGSNANAALDYGNARDYLGRAERAASRIGDGDMPAATRKAREALKAYRATWRMTPQRLRAIVDAQNEVGAAEAESTPDKQDDLVSIINRTAATTTRMRQIDRQLRRRLPPEKRAALLSERAGLITTRTSLRGEYDTLTAPPDAGDVPSELDFINRDYAIASLNNEPGAEAGYQGRLADYYRRKLTEAQGTADPRDDIDAAQGLKAALDALKQTVEDNTAAQRDLEKQRADEATRNLAVSQSQYGVLARAIADISNRRLGGTLGLAAQSPSAPGRFSSVGGL